MLQGATVEQDITDGLQGPACIHTDDCARALELAAEDALRGSSDDVDLVTAGDQVSADLNHPRRVPVAVARDVVGDSQALGSGGALRHTGTTTELGYVDMAKSGYG
jgi:hypothetical protein